jgi:hypothetical protein
MRRLLTVLLATALAAGACSSEDGGDEPTATTASEAPAQLVEFLEGVAPQGELAFTATYRVLQKVGGTETEVRVMSTPPSWTITAGDATVSGPPKPSTSEEAKLSALGVFSNFYADGPKRALLADSRRAGAGAPVFSEQTLAGVDLQCVAVPQSGVVTQTACLTDEGVFAYVDSVSVRIELTSYEVTAGR